MNSVANKCLWVVLFVFSVSAVLAQNLTRITNKPDDFISTHYAKSEYRISMRDGVKLFTIVYAPRDKSRHYPILLVRTPYSVSPYGKDDYPNRLGPADSLTREGFIFVYQDVRGRYLSEGEFVDMPPNKTHLDGPTDTDPSTDTYDTIDWLIKNIPNNNGRVGMWGVSYPGFYAAHGLINSHPALKADSPQAPMGDVGNGDDSYHNGAFFLSANFGFYTGFWPRGPKPAESNSHKGFKFGTPDDYDFYLRLGPLSNAEDICFKHQNPYWSQNVAHPDYDEFWSSRAIGPDMHHLTAPVLLVGGWFDAEDLGGTLKLFRAIEADGSAPALTLVMGPWSHGQWSGQDGHKLGNLEFGSKTAEYFRDQIEYPFFMQALKDKGDTKLPKAWLFETGENKWRQFDAWPPANAARRSLFLMAGGKLGFSSSEGEGFDEYTSDPSKPVPVISEIGNGMPGDYMTRDQRFAGQRPDVLTYESEPLKSDVTIAGPVTPVLRVSTSGTDSDFVVKLIDVYPDDSPDPVPNPQHVHFGGYEQMVRGEPFRGKFRDSMSNPAPFIPGQPAKIEFAMPDVLHKFRAGHRIMVQIQSSWFPMVDRNPQQFEDIPSAKA
ncbi:MAG TPA: CocE/NonD family hydrolase, partial [Verrucomicrobiae bacterium]|nr:CocE/NonD family hydrolase [Verrucomicrobiae bacterium]